MKIHYATSFSRCLLHALPISLPLMCGKENIFLCLSFCYFLHPTLIYPLYFANAYFTNLLLKQLGFVAYDKK
jgi:hypothetical protein